MGRLVTEEAEDMGGIVHPVEVPEWDKKRDKDNKGRFGREEWETQSRENFRAVWTVRHWEELLGGRANVCMITKNNRDVQHGGYSSPNLEGSPSDVDRG